jgi:hypothetical protein
VEKGRQRLVELHRELVAAYPQAPQCKSNLANALQELAEFYLERGKQAQARDALTQAVQQQQAAVQGDRQQAVYRASLWKHYLSLIEVSCELEDHAAASKAATELLSGAEGKGPDYARVALLLGRCAQLAGKDSKLTPAKRGELVGHYGDQAVEYLRRAFATGYQDLPSLKEAAEWETIRKREDFQKLMAEKGGKKTQ